MNGSGPTSERTSLLSSCKELRRQRSGLVGMADRSLGWNLSTKGFEASIVVTRDGETLEKATESTVSRLQFRPRNFNSGSLPESLSKTMTRKSETRTSLDAALILRPRTQEPSKMQESW